MAIYSTYCDGKAYIAANQHYIGCVDSEKGVSFFNFFWNHMTVNFGGKFRSVNSEGYKTLVSGLLNRKIEDISTYSNFQDVVDELKLENFTTFIRDAIPNEHRNKLFKKLAKAISNRDTPKAIKYIGKGADISTKYYDREGLPPVFNKVSADGSIKPLEILSEDLSERYRWFKVFEGSPIQNAAIKKLSLVIAQLEMFGALLENKGEGFYFKRDLYGKMETETRLVASPSPFPTLPQTESHTRLVYYPQDKTYNYFTLSFMKKKKEFDIVVKEVHPKN